MSRLIRLLVAAFTLTALLGAPLASEAAPRAKAAGRATAPFSWIWSFLAQAWEKAGCRIDPDGLCVPEAPKNTKEGCLIDPNGRCVTGPQAVPDNGCHIDPFGLCASGN
jgi:hypothetical protein